MTANTPRGAGWFWLLGAGHVMVWTLLPVLSHPNAPLDVVSSTYWGHEWQWGYYLHPPLPAWLAEAARQVGGGAWLIYLLSQVAMLICLWSVWRLAADLLSPGPACWPPRSWKRPSSTPGRRSSSITTWRPCRSSAWRSSASIGL